MLAQVILQLLCVFSTDYRLVGLLERDGALKSSRQIASHHKYAEKYFNMKVSDPTAETWNWDVFMYLSGKETVAYGLAAVKDGMEKRSWKLPFVNIKKRVPYVSFYSLMVVEQHRGQGLCDKFLRDIVGFLKKSHCLPSNALLTLHLSPRDPLMFVAAKIYYRMGFTNGAFSTVGPHQFQNQMSRLLDNSCDLYSIMDEPKASGLPGGFITLYCRLKDFGKPRLPPFDSIEKGKRLMGFLDRRMKNAQ